MWQVKECKKLREFIMSSEQNNVEFLPHRPYKAECCLWLMKKMCFLVKSFRRVLITAYLFYMYVWLMVVLSGQSSIKQAYDQKYSIHDNCMFFVLPDK